MESRSRTRACPSLISPLIHLSFFLLLLSSLLDPVLALRFELQSQPRGHPPRCIRNFVARDTLVLVTSNISGHRGDGQTVDIHVKDAIGNEYGRPRDVVGESRLAFTSHSDSAFDVCFTNTFAHSPARGSTPLSRQVELDVDIGADARDWGEVAAQEKLRPVEADVRKVEEQVEEVVRQMEYLREREMRLRNTNESTNERVKWFAIGSMAVLVGLGGWQIVYLRAYFRSKHLI